MGKDHKCSASLIILNMGFKRGGSEPMPWSGEAVRQQALPGCGATLQAGGTKCSSAGAGPPLAVREYSQGEEVQSFSVW